MRQTFVPQGRYGIGTAIAFALVILTTAAVAGAEVTGAAVAADRAEQLQAQFRLEHSAGVPGAAAVAADWAEQLQAHFLLEHGAGVPGAAAVAADRAEQLQAHFLLEHGTG